MGSYIIVSEEFKEKVRKELEDCAFFRYLDQCLDNGNLEAVYELLSFNVRTNLSDEELKELLKKKDFKTVETHLNTSNQKSLALSKKCLKLLMEIKPRD
jgi:adenine specific DNA methylase Mod